MRFRAIALALSFPICANSQSATLPISEIAGDLGISGSLTIEDIEPQGERCAIAVSVLAPNLFSELDRIGKSKGNMGSSRNRLYWVGPTKLKGVEGTNTILLTSRARYESWTYINLVFDEIKTKNFQDTKTVDLRLMAAWIAENDTLKLDYEIQNIRNFPGSLEKALRSLGVEFGGSSTLEMPRSSATERLKPKLSEGPTFSAIPDNKGLQVNATLTANLPKNFLVDSCIALQSTLANKPERLSEFALNIIDGM